MFAEGVDSPCAKGTARVGRHCGGMSAVVAMTAMVSFGAEQMAVDFRPPCIVPAPLEMAYKHDTAVILDANTRIAVRCPDADAAGWVREKGKGWFGVKLRIETVESLPAAAEGREGYVISAKPGRIEIDANALQGVRHAMYTLRQVAERRSEGSELKGYWLPALEVKDSPQMAFRGLHLCWFPELSPTFIERQIRLAAYYKFNHVVLESWGVFRSVRHRQFAWRDAPLTPSEAGRLAALAADLGVTLVPQVNVYGHASFSRSCSGKHSTLDFNPGMQSLFEPDGGWNWCLSNPDATAALRDFVDEVHEAFGRPPFFHIGCDEAEPPSCATCRAARPYGRLVAAHMASVCELLRARGARAMMWHDMLLEKGDSRWKGFYAHGAAEDVRAILDVLPKDVIVCDWYYGSDPVGTDKTVGTAIVDNYPTLDYFASSGFDVVTCPWRNVKGIEAQCRFAREHRLFGMLETVWHKFRGQEFADMTTAAANGAWRGGKTAKSGKWTAPFAVHWRQAGWDMDVKDYRETGYYENQVTRDVLDR